MDYFTVDGFILRTGYSNKKDWYLLPIKEILDNDTDFLWKWYKGESVYVEVDISIGNSLFRLKVRNSNPRNIQVFQDLDAVFNYDIRYGSKQDVHIISRGILGDAMKQIGALGYILTNVNNGGTEFTDKQWEHPLIIRHNREEWKIDIGYSKAEQKDTVKTELSLQEIAYTDTEIELVLPIIDQVRDSLNVSYIERFCREYSILATDISFKFSISEDDTAGSAIDGINLTNSKSDTEPSIFDDLYSDPAVHSLTSQFR
jgi:hypothetical protein